MFRIKDICLLYLIDIRIPYSFISIMIEHLNLKKKIIYIIIFKLTYFVYPKKILNTIVDTAFCIIYDSGSRFPMSMPLIGLRHKIQ